MKSYFCLSYKPFVWGMPPPKTVQCDMLLLCRLALLLVRIETGTFVLHWPGYGVMALVALEELFKLVIGLPRFYARKWNKILCQIRGFHPGRILDALVIIT